MGRGSFDEVRAALYVGAEVIGVGRTVVRSKDHVEGTGLGLALSQALAEAMGGSLSFTSTQGTGSVFTLTIPRAEHPPRDP